MLYSKYQKRSSLNNYCLLYTSDAADEQRGVDIDGIGMYTLGKYRKSLSEDQKIKYKKLFKSYFLKSFSSRLVDYSDPKINVVSEKN